METPTTAKNKQNDTSPGTPPVVLQSDAGEVLTKQGLWVMGEVLTCEKAEHRTGKSLKGREYSFWSRKITLFCEEGEGGETMVLNETKDEEAGFALIKRREVASFRVLGCRLDGSSMVLRV